MSLLRKHFRIALWIAEELAGVISGEDQARLDAWREEHPVHAREYDEIRAYVAAGKEDEEVEKECVKREWQKFEREHFRKYVIWRKIGRYAAVLVLPLLIGGYFGVASWLDGEQPVVVSAGIVPGGGKARLVMANGRALNLDEKLEVKLDLPGMKVVTDGKKIVYRAMGEPVADTLTAGINTLFVPRGGEYMLELPDGTRVWLNSDSELRFPVRFAGDKRVVEIEGEAYFEVARNEKWPFHVMARGTDIRVLGTSFNVSTYRGRTVTTLVEGRVCLTHGTGAVMMLPGRQVEVMAETGEMIMREVDAKSFTLWKDGVFYFEGADLETITERLSRWYDVDIVFEDEELKKSRFSVEMKRYDEIQDLLTKIEKTRKVKFLIQGKAVRVHKWLDSYDLIE
ncbi:FecR domain-containing protein [Odoribacter sp. AF15-53]|mgnify:CR=1 FL=1|uniref:FecR family protein n=1 Tax=Odoribacter sp. AF15-53 TaxID=2292236 RepID=UPI000E5333C0|nr:FecR domain-containing protein [Odoribacter sp. AF15-53]RHR82755.1 DUF4974 domain-containing protein [Odoribacter sp. AF15-53]